MSESKPAAPVFIVGFDATEAAQRATDYAAAEAQRCGAHVHMVYVLQWSGHTFLTALDQLRHQQSRRDADRDRARKLVEPVAARLVAQGISASWEVRHGRAAETIVEIAHDRHASHIFVGRKSRPSLADRILGGVASLLVQSAPVPVTVIP